MLTGSNGKHNLIKRAEEREKVYLVSANKLDDAELEIELIHQNGYIIFAISESIDKKRIWHQWGYRKEEIGDKLISNMLGFNMDTYVALNSFKSPNKRTISNLYSLNALWVDLDYYKTEYKDKNYKEFIEILSKDSFIKEIPPSLWVYSGNGLYGLWIIENAHAQSCIALWNKLMEVINKRLEQYGADTKSIDASHVLRLPGSRNTKTSNIAKVVNFNNIEYKKYTLGELANLLLPPLQYSREEWLKLKKKKRKTKKEKESCKTRSLFNIHTLNYARMQDIETLIELREGDCEGNRELMLFLYRYWGNCYYKDDEKALKEILELNKMFKIPLGEDEVKNATKRAQEAYKIWETKLEEYWKLEEKVSVDRFFKNTGCYVYSNKKLIEQLSITQEEMGSLKTIINSVEKLKRRNENRKAQRRDENGLTSRARAKMEKIYKVIEFKEKGLTQKEMASRLNCSIATIERYVKEIKDKNITKPVIEMRSFAEIEINLKESENELALVYI